VTKALRDEGLGTMSNDVGSAGPGSIPADLGDLAERIEALQRRVERLEADLVAAQQLRGPVPIETILAISAAVAAYLGKKATVRQIHYSHSDTWARLGRSAVHASHTFSRRMG